MSTLPAELFALRSDIDLGKGMSMEHEDLIELSLDAIGSTITVVGSSIDEGSDFSNTTLASLLYALEAHISAIRAVVTHARVTCPHNQKADKRRRREAHLSIAAQGGLVNHDPATCEICQGELSR